MTRYELVLLKRHLEHAVRTSTETLSRYKDRLENIEGGKELYEQMNQELEAAKMVLEKVKTHITLWKQLTDKVDV